MILVSLSLRVTGGEESFTFHYQAPVSLLHELVIGEVVTCCGPRYEALRTVNNKACISRPSVIVVPATTEDVAITVNFARRNGLEVSVRSGGHGYTCTNIRDRGIHVDLRR